MTKRNLSSQPSLQPMVGMNAVDSKESRLTICAERKETLAEDVTEADFNSYIAAANSRISLFDLEIRSTFHQISRQRVHALVNSTSDPIMQLATVHTAEEISFLKRLLDAMFETFNTTRQEVMAITSFQAMKLAKPPSEDRRETQKGSTTQGSSGQGLTMVQAEKMLKALVDGGWFEKSRKGFFSLAPRALMELRGWLFETYNDVGSDDDEDGEERGEKIKVCGACKEIITSVSISRIILSARLMLGRVKDAQGRPVHSDYTISAPKTSFVYKSRPDARCARKNGRATPLSVSALSRPRVQYAKTSEPAAHHSGDNRRLLWKDQPRSHSRTNSQMEKRRQRRTMTKKRKSTARIHPLDVRHQRGDDRKPIWLCCIMAGATPLAVTERSSAPGSERISSRYEYGVPIATLAFMSWLQLAKPSPQPGLNWRAES